MRPPLHTERFDRVAWDLSTAIASQYKHICKTGHESVLEKIKGSAARINDYE